MKYLVHLVRVREDEGVWHADTTAKTRIFLGAAEAPGVYVCVFIHVCMGVGAVGELLALLRGH